MSQKEKLHFLHIGKTGGTAIKYALRNNLDKGRYEIILHNHNTTLEDVPKGDKFFLYKRS